MPSFFFFVTICACTLQMFSYVISATFCRSLFQDEFLMTNTITGRKMIRILFKAGAKGTAAPVNFEQRVHVPVNKLA